MISFLNQIDTELFLYLNSIHSSQFDSIMLFFSYNKGYMLGLISLLIVLGYKVYKKNILALFFISLVVFGLSDSISTRVFKNNFERLRPCHQTNISSQVYTANKKCGGGKFGFVSSHASNSFAIALFFWLLLKARFKWTSLLFLNAFIVSYSRIYLGRHYPFDIICGALLGLVIAYLIFRLVQKFLPNLLKQYSLNSQ